MANTFKFGGGNWAVKDGYALAYNDENNNFKPLPFDFTRASTATRVNKQGLIKTVPSGKPRIDFLDNTSGHLLLEPSRTNLVLYSEDFSGSSWALQRISISSSNVVAPNGELTATKIIEDNSNATHQTRPTSTISLSAGQPYTYSCFVKKDERDEFRIENISQSGAYFNLQNKTINADNTSIIKNTQLQELSNGWFKCSVTIQEASRTADYIYLLIAKDGSKSYQGDGTSGLNIWGAMVEQGSYATSYIPTEGSSVTRVAETSEINSVPNVPTSYPFVMYVEGNHTLGQESGVCGFYDKSNQFQYYSILFSSNNKVLAISRQPGTENTLTSTSTYTDGFHKIAVLFLNDTTIKLYVDGELDSTKTDCSNNSFNTAFTDYVIGVFRSNSTNSCNIKDFRIFNHELTDTELKNLTS